MLTRWSGWEHISLAEYSLLALASPQTIWLHSPGWIPAHDCTSHYHHHHHQYHHHYRHYHEYQPSKLPPPIFIHTNENDCTSHHHHHHHHYCHHQTPTSLQSFWLRPCSQLSPAILGKVSRKNLLDFVQMRGRGKCPAQIFCHLFISALSVNKRSLFPPKCQ